MEGQFAIGPLHRDAFGASPARTRRCGSRRSRQPPAARFATARRTGGRCGELPGSTSVIAITARTAQSRPARAGSPSHCGPERCCSHPHGTADLETSRHRSGRGSGPHSSSARGSLRPRGPKGRRPPAGQDARVQPRGQSSGPSRERTPHLCLTFRRVVRFANQHRSPLGFHRASQAVPSEGTAPSLVGAELSSSSRDARRGSAGGDRPAAAPSAASALLGA
jgi:hypothetical protein